LAAPKRTVGPKSDKLWRDAIMIAVKRDAIGGGGKYLDKLARALLDKAAEGDVAALREVGDRLDGKPTQALEHTDPHGGNPFQPLMDLIAANGRPRPSSSR